MELEKKKIADDIFELMCIMKQVEDLKEITHEQLINNIKMFRKQLGLIGLQVSKLQSEEEKTKRAAEKAALQKSVEDTITNKLGMKEKPSWLKVDVA